jgi:redox-sensitive bicupin YhaK (pirin superfamily)
MSRTVEQIIPSERHREGGGFVVRRPFPTYNIDHIDPFLLIDEMGPVTYLPGQAVGAPDHPHRGFETVTYFLDGEGEHEDSAGHRGVLRAGDVQWMTAGAGIVHSEMPSQRIVREGGRVHGFQIWVNLPGSDKMMAPRYQEVPATSIPVATTADGKARVRVIAGEAMGRRAVIDTRTPILYQDWTLEPGGAVEQSIPSDYNAMAFVFQGRLLVGGIEVADGELAVLGPGDAVRLTVPADASEPARLLLLGGVPIGEPVARYGPVVMNTEVEVRKAIMDFRSGQFGEIRRAVPR